MDAPIHSHQEDSVVSHSVFELTTPLAGSSEPSTIVRPVERAAEAIREFDAEMITAWIRHAGILIRHREYSAAQSLLRHSLAKDPNNEVAIAVLATSFEKAGHQEQAVKCRRALVRLNPSVCNRLDLATLYYTMEDDEQALAIYRDVLSSDLLPDDRVFEVYKNVGNISVRRRDFEAAEEYYNRAFAIDSKSDALMVNFGTLEINRDNLEAATERFRVALQINEKNDRAWVGIALVHRSKGDFELSWANLERALDLNPSNRTALKLLVEWAVRDGRVQGAAERLESYLALDGEDAEMAFSFAKCLTLLGRFNDALLECERVVALDPEQEEAIRLRRVLAERIVAEAGSGQ